MRPASFSRMVLLTVSLCVLGFSCEPSSPEQPTDTNEILRLVVNDYISTYQARDDWHKFLSFYSDSLYFLDVNLRTAFQDKEGFAAFYDWPNPNFEKTAPEQLTFTVEDLIVADHTAIIKGRFLPFYWQGELKEWTELFTIWLHFDDDWKIVRQYDFIKYPKIFLPE